MEIKPPPKTEQELLERCQTLSGKTLAELAEGYHSPVPHTLVKSKGWMGQLIEWHLGANSQHLPQPDFLHLNIELKTLPLNANGLPQESTYVSTAPLTLETSLETWATSRVRHKLARVLWIPIQADPKIPIANRRVGSALLWELPPEIENILRRDWEELTEMLILGQVDKISARYGTYLHIRPKAAHSRIQYNTVNEDGENISAGPKGFYLRTTLTKRILEESYCG